MKDAQQRRAQPDRRRPLITVKGLLTLASYVAIVLWVIMWAQNIERGSFSMNARPSFLVWPTIGLDFSGSYLAAHHLLQGGNPYVENFGDFRGTYAYPPAALGFHLWVYFFDAPHYLAAVGVWGAFVAAVMTIATVLARRVRAVLRLEPIPLVFMIAAVLWSMPVLFAMERGNCDAIVLMLILCALPALRRRGWMADIILGFCTALAAWVKIYPGLLVFALWGLRRPRATLLGMVWMVVIPLILWPGTKAFIHNTRTAQHDRSAPLSDVVTWLSHPVFQQTDAVKLVEPYAHSVTTYWANLVGGTPLMSIPGMLGAAVVLFPAGVWLGRRLHRSPRMEEMAYPFLLWVATVATFYLPYSFDYNLIYFPILVLAIWSRRDPVIVHLLLSAGIVAWWQPLYLGLNGVLAMYLKLLSLLAVTISLSCRLDEIAAGQQPVVGSTKPANATGNASLPGPEPGVNCPPAAQAV